MTTARLAVDADARDLAAAEHLVHRLDEVLGAGQPEDAYVISTHVVREPTARFVAVLDWPGGPAVEELTALLADRLSHAYVSHDSPAIEEAADRTAGRLARYPGRTRIETVTTVAAVEADSVVDDVEGLAGIELEPGDTLDLTGFARPVWRAGRCVLLVQRSATGLVPFEVRNQIRCCSDH
ncbi:hypothetical protein SAMN05428985_104173 [Nocardioides sp. YR527]|uniref:hypothetical protein n=1 Tax=Nocardioides sp. YR527 TaxID=1881028 RepID=UPI00087E42C2|nr:hypothetical protein [Nocardioides sp. YR527]SDK48034.1 hypothetical protein SAMN05428985_104173 [Nocardioides sp. YR527]